MRLYIVLVVLAFAAGRAHADDATEVDGDAEPTGGKIYLSGGIETVVMSTPTLDVPDAERAAMVEAGYRLGGAPIYAHAAVASAPSGYLDSRAGIELRAGGFVKGIAGLDLGYQHDERMVDAFHSVEGALVAPRLGVEIGSRTFWVRGSFDWRYTLARTGGGRAASFGLSAGHDF